MNHEAIADTAPSVTTAKPKRVSARRWIEKARRYWVVVALATFASGVAIGADAVKKGREALESLGVVPSPTLELATSTARSQFSERLIRAGSLRLYWAEVYVTRLRNNGPKEDIDLAWRNYVDSSAQWNADLLINLFGMDRYYDKTRKKLFKDELQTSMVALDTKLSAIRRVQGDSANLEEQADLANGAIQSATFTLGMLITCAPAKAGEKAMHSGCALDRTGNMAVK